MRRVLKLLSGCLVACMPALAQGADDWKPISILEFRRGDIVLFTENCVGRLGQTRKFTKDDIARIDQAAKSPEGNCLRFLLDSITYFVNPTVVATDDLATTVRSICTTEGSSDAVTMSNLGVGDASGVCPQKSP